MGVDQSPQPYIGAVPPGAYWIRNSYSGNALDLEGSNAAPGTPIVNYQVHRGLNQKWILEPGIRGYKIKNAKTGTFMGFASHDGINKGSSISGNPAAIEWDIVSEGSNYKIRLSADTSLILDLANYGTENGNKVIVWPDNCGANQHWILESCNPATYVGIIGPGAYWIRNGHTKAALDLAVPSCAPATPVINGEITRRPSQKWILETGTHGFRFKNAETGTYLSIAYRLAPVKYMNVTCNPLPMEWDVVKNGWNYRFVVFSSIGVQS
ncbi:hypothetical protein FRC02_004847 [Tulasnella sp. 418]|nr:hypothetical protein FRC02_004847 [Tulasnella sp. 418]